MNRSGSSFCPNCGKEFETAGPELHAPNCQYMLIEAYFVADKLGYKAKDDRDQSSGVIGWDRDDRSA